VASTQTTRPNPDFAFVNLQGNSQYRFVAEAYKLGGIVASNSLTFNIANDTVCTVASLSLTVPYVSTTLAGSITAGFADGSGNTARFNNPCEVKMHPSGNLYIADPYNHCIRKMAPNGQVTTVAGNGTAAYVDGPLASARFNTPVGVGFDTSGNLYVVDTLNSAIRKIATDGTVSTLAGNGTAGFADGVGGAARFNNPYGIALDAQNNLYIADVGNCMVRKVTPAGSVTTIAGKGGVGFVDAQGTNAMFYSPHALTLDAQGNIYVADAANHAIRKVNTTGYVSTVAGNGTANYVEGTGMAARLNAPRGITVDGAGNLYVVDSNNCAIRKITPGGVVSTISGRYTGGATDGTGTAALFNAPFGIDIDARGMLYIGDEHNNLIRKLQ
jgi:sugar lactone lactonase YvrE